MGTKALQAPNIHVRISTLVWKLNKAIENAKEQDILFTEVDAVSKLAANSFKLFLEYGVFFFFFFNIFNIFFSILMGRIQ